jgi:serine/threonine protein kinase
MMSDDPKDRTVTRPHAKVVPPEDGDATVIRPKSGATAMPLPEDSDATVIRPVSGRTQQPGFSASGFPATSLGAPPPPAAPTPRPDAPDMGNHLPVGTFLGEFEITELLGEGGFGIVYLARDHSLERRVALKEYMPSALAARTGGTNVSVKSERHRETFEAGLKSFVNEARLLAQFDHPSLVKVYRFWEANGTAYMIMPFYEGITLKQKLKDLGSPPNEAWLLELLEPLTEALTVIHAEQCFHRDIAPDNVILLKGTNRPLLLDFGAARRVIGDMTQALTVILKPGYAPVEQYAEVPGMKQGPWTDVYALAAVVYFAIVGKTPPTSVGRLMNDNYQPLAQLAAGKYSDGFLKAIDAALVVKPEERTQSIEDLRHALGFGGSAPKPRPKPSAAPAAAAGSGRRTADDEDKPKSKMPLVVLGGLVLLAAIGGGIYATLPSPKPAPAPTEQQAAPAPAAAPVAQAPVAAPEPPPPPPPPPFDPVRELDRIAAAQAAGFGVVATPARPELRIGKDRLSFTVRSERDGVVSVLAYASDGQLYQLFPNSSVKTTRIRAGQTITLPPASFPLDSTGPEGTDEFLVIVSPNPRDFSAARFDMSSGVGTLSRDAAERVAAAHGGAASAFTGTPVCAAPCADEYGAARFSSRQVR